MASMIALGESSSKKSPWIYEVFLSFRGEDTRKNFTDHLYNALMQKGIITYRDDRSLKRGQNISNALLQAIQNSKYLIVILSRDYASSTWCLEELAKIMECIKGEEQMAIPIFYKVDPSDIRQQKGTFKMAFVQQEMTFKDDMDKVQRWKNALIEITSISGWVLGDRPESQFIQDIVEDLQKKLETDRVESTGKSSIVSKKRLKDSAEGVVVCKCGYKAKCSTAQTEQNRGRKFYGCPNYNRDVRCNFFRWADDVAKLSSNCSDAVEVYKKRESLLEADYLISGCFLV